MTSIYEVDWRYSPTEQVLSAISVGLNEVATKVVPVDIDEALEQWESLLGIAFVMAQTYITGTVSDVNKITRSSPPLKKVDLLKKFSRLISGTKVTGALLIDAIANYYKHHDEWPDWSPVGARKSTIEVLNEVGIHEHDSHPCRKAANMLLTPPDSFDLKPLFSIIVDWRKNVITAYT
jgi:hypothetical protein